MEDARGRTKDVCRSKGNHVSLLGYSLRQFAKPILIFWVRKMKFLARMRIKTFLAGGLVMLAWSALQWEGLGGWPSGVSAGRLRDGGTALASVSRSGGRPRAEQPGRDVRQRSRCATGRCAGRRLVPQSGRQERRSVALMLVVAAALAAALARRWLF
jgi:hypothetical protein